MLDTPCVSTPLRSAVTSTSAPTAASSGGTPIFSKTAVTVRLRDHSGTRTSSFSGTVNLFSICFTLGNSSLHMAAEAAGIVSLRGRAATSLKAAGVGRGACTIRLTVEGL